MVDEKLYTYDEAKATGKHAVFTTVPAKEQSYASGDLRKHSVNYFLQKTGLRDYCSKCAGCCFVCSSFKNYEYGCRNEQCLFHLCWEMTFALQDAGRDDVVAVFRWLLNEPQPIDEVKQRVDALPSVVSLLQSLYKKPTRGLKQLQERKSLHTVNMKLIARAKVFDDATKKLFGDACTPLR